MPTMMDVEITESCFVLPSGRRVHAWHGTRADLEHYTRKMFDQGATLDRTTQRKVPVRKFSMVRFLNELEAERAS